MTETNQNISDQARRLLVRAVGKSHFVFNAEEAKQAAVQIGISQPYMHQLLQELVEAGWLFKIKRGLYGSTGQLPGYSVAHDFAIATRIVEPSALCRLTALSFHELTEQISFSTIHVMTQKKVFTPGMRIGEKPEGRGRHAWIIRGLRYEFFQVKPEHFFGIERVYVAGTVWVPMTDRERTLLDLFVPPVWFGNFPFVLSLVRENLEEGTFDVDRLIKYALRYGEASVIKRIGWSLEEMGVAAEKLEPLRQYKISGYRLLDPSRLAQGKCNKRWMIIENLKAGYEDRESEAV